jgi:hypothetical protein
MLPSMATKTKLAKHFTRCSDAALWHPQIDFCAAWHSRSAFDSVAAWQDIIHNGDLLRHRV